MTRVWRINLKPGGIRTQSFCLERGVLGVGWPVEAGDLPLSWTSYYELGKTKYGDRGWNRALNALKNRIQVNDLCWTRDSKGIYYIGRILSDWRYENGKEFEEAEIFNVRSCNWKKIGSVEKVPGKVVRSFIPSATLQEIADSSVVIFSQFKYNEVSDSFKYEITPLGFYDIFSLLSPEDCEDLVACYLQHRLGYMVVPSSCKDDTLAYEYVLQKRTDGSVAVAQVKSGYVSLATDVYGDFPGEVFLFTTDGEYTGTPTGNVHCMSKADLTRFMEEFRSIMPGKIQLWLEVFEELGSLSLQPSDL